jgi:fatty-acyl-CoA synthase
VEIPLTPLDFLERARRLFPNRVGVIDGELRLTYAQFAERCHRLGHALRSDLGVQPGDRVAWLCGNTHELLEAYYGVLLSGAVLLPLNVRLSSPELRFILDDSGAAVLFRHPDQPDPGHAVRQVLLGPEHEALLGAQGAGLVEPSAVDERSAAEIFYTSGTTGDPKGAILTHRALYLHAVHSALTMGMSGNDTVLHTIPLFHVNGWGTPHYLTALGGVHVMLPRFEPAEVLRLVEQERVTRLFLVPTMATMLLAYRGLADHDLSSLTQVSVGGAAAGPELMAALEEQLGCEAICGYGLTEASPQLTKALDKPGEARSALRRATTGMPIIGVDLRVMDDDDREVAHDGQTPGEVCARSNHVMEGYWNQPAATAAALRGGWLRTGDIATVDDAGYITIVDRKKDIIVSGGENVSSLQVEKVLASHPAVLEAAVVAAPDQRWGEVPVAWVSLRADQSASEAELIAFARERLAHFKAPKVIHFLPELPKGGTGKILKAELRSRSGTPRPID